MVPEEYTRLLSLLESNSVPLALSTSTTTASSEHSVVQEASTASTAERERGLPAPKKGRKFKGIRMRSWGKVVCEIRGAEGKRIWLGSYTTEVHAARVYDEAARVLQGDRAWLNFPGEAPGAVELPRGTLETLMRHKEILEQKKTGSGWRRNLPGKRERRESKAPRMERALVHDCGSLPTSLQDLHVGFVMDGSDAAIAAASPALSLPEIPEDWAILPASEDEGDSTGHLTGDEWSSLPDLSEDISNFLSQGASSLGSALSLTFDSDSWL